MNTPTNNPSAMTFRFTIGDVEHCVSSGRITGDHSRALRRVLGVGFTSMLNAVLAGDLDADYLAGLVWLSRVQAGETRLALEVVMAETTFDDIARFDAIRDDGEPPILPGTAVTEDDSPEA